MVGLNFCPATLTLLLDRISKKESKSFVSIRDDIYKEIVSLLILFNSFVKHELKGVLKYKDRNLDPPSLPPHRS
jgi:hypothetical protein